MFVVPVEKRSELSAKILSSQWHDRRPTEEIRLKREDESLDDRNAAVLTDGAVAGLDVPVATPLAKAWIVELRAAVADQVFRFGANGLNRPTQQGAHGGGGRLLRERGHAHGATRKMIDDDGSPPTERPTLR